MCNLYTQTKSVDEIASLFRELQIPLTFPEGAPNLIARDIAITDSGPIVRASETGHELLVRRWSWPGPGGKPVYNFRSDGRSFGSGRCLILTDGFYEFTAAADPKQRRKDRWKFSFANDEPMAIAGIVRTTPGIGEAFTMLTTEPGPDVAPFHNRQVAVLTAPNWKAWLDHRGLEMEMLTPLPGGSLDARLAPREAAIT